MTEFDPTIRVGEGTTLLEASAGTGKTHAVASLVVHEVAEGRPIDELLVVTFTRKATGTLRERVWERLAEAADALEDPSAPAPDELVAHLRLGDEVTVAARAAHLRRALSDFDAATIATTHGFCQQVLASLGVAGDAEREVEVVEDVADLVRDAIDDLFVRRFHDGDKAPLFDRAVAEQIARAVVGNPDAALAPVDDNDENRLRRNFALGVRRRVIEHKRRGRLVTYDDLLTRLAESVEDPVRGELVVDRLRRRFSMAVVDEFQDTDAVQWRILSKAFGSAPCRLVLVGDPKQAIYAFRGGDVHAYLQATAGAAKLELPISWRSDQALLDGIDGFLAGAQLGDASITHRPLRARAGADRPRLLGGSGAPLTVRILAGHTGNKAPLREAVADDVADEVVRLLASGAQLVERDLEGEEAGERRPVGTGDLAILVRRHADGDAIRACLAGRGVAAVVHGGIGVLLTPAAHAWLDLLRAIEVPSSTGRVRTLAHGPFVGWSAERLATAPDEDWEALDGWLHDWSVGLRLFGIAGLLRRVEASQHLTARLVATPGGERLLADLRHVGELLHERLSAHPSSVAVLAGWLVEQVVDARTTESGDVRRRLESDAAAVTIQTIHGAKGLEFPIVLLPSLWEGPWLPDDALPTFHADDGSRQLGVGGRGGQLHADQLARHVRERDEEDLRLLYVALTRAKHRVIAWWATGKDASQSPFARILLGRDAATGAVVQQLPRKVREGDVRAALEELAARTRGAVGIEDIGGPPPAIGPESSRGAARTLGLAAFDRTFDRRWTRTSYSALTAAAHDAGPGLHLAEAEAKEAAEAPAPDRDDVDAPPTTVDEPLDTVDAAAVGTVVEPVAGDPRLAEVVLGPLPGGADFGTLVHAVLEDVDFTAADLRAEVAAGIDEPMRKLLHDPTRADALVDGLVASLQTPLGDLLDGRPLAGLAKADRLDELAFDLPLAGGDAPVGFVTMEAIADVFEEHLPADGLLGRYHERLRDPLLATEVRGFLSGSIDLVARVRRAGEAADRHVVVDYKTNRLAPVAEPLTSWHYRASAMVEAMQDSHYPLQAAIYVVALHRYLRWRLRGYDPDVHLGGVGYLFLRGMTGADAPLSAPGEAPCGVFSWHPPTAFVLALSDVIDRGAAGSAAVA